MGFDISFYRWSDSLTHKCGWPILDYCHIEVSKIMAEITIMQSKTEKNLTHAFAAESKASARNSALALKAGLDGYPQIAHLFRAYPRPNPSMRAGTYILFGGRSAQQRKISRPPSTTRSRHMWRNTRSSLKTPQRKG